MNDFYDDLKKSVISYTESDMFPEKGKYFAKASVTKEDDKISIKVDMRLRLGAETTSSKSMTHVWKDGVVKQKLTQ